MKRAKFILHYNELSKVATLAIVPERAKELPDGKFPVAIFLASKEGGKMNINSYTEDASCIWVSDMVDSDRTLFSNVWESAKK